MFTRYNTSGFTDAELTTLNAALGKLVEEQIDATGDDTPEWKREQLVESLSERISNAWHHGVTLAELIEAARVH